MKIAYNPKTGAALTTAPANNDITFDLRGLNIFVRGEKFKGTDTTYSVFKKHTSAGSGGYNGLVPVPSYTTTNIRFLREDGTWSIPTSLIYTQLTNQDLDDYLDEGKWYYAGENNSVINKPSGVDSFELYVGRNASSYRYQKLITENNIIWFRQYNSTAWGTWVRWYTDENTDQKVLQSATTTANFRPLILGYNNSTDKSVLANDTTNQVYTTTTIYAQPSTGSLWANKLYSGGKPVLIEHQSLANYVTLNTEQTITGIKTFTKQQKFIVAKGTAPFQVTSDTKVTNLNADLLDGYHSTSYLPYTIYEYEKGCLVKTDIPTKSNTMVTFIIEGNSYSGNTIFTTGEFYNYSVQDEILQYGAYHHGHNFGNITVFCYDGYVYIWFKQSKAFQSFVVTVYGTNTTPNNTNRVTSITNADLPTTGITRKVEITPRISLNSSNYTSYIKESNFPGLNKVGTVTSVAIANGGGLSVAGSPITTSGTITITNTGVRSVTIGTNDNANKVAVNTGGTTTYLTIPYAIYSTHLIGGVQGSIPYQSAADTTTFLAAPTTNGYVLKYNTTDKKPYWAADSDTKNTAGSTNSTSKLFLIGATSQETNPQTYSNSSVYTTNGALYATSFIGNLDGTYINKLTNYSKATAIGSIATTDSLNTALGKLEFKTDFIYNDLFGTDNDDVINKWHEIVDFIDSVKEGTDILDEFVTRKTAQTITGIKTFTKQQNFTAAQGTAPFTVTSTTKIDNLNADLLDGKYLSNAVGNIPYIVKFPSFSNFGSDHSTINYEKNILKWVYTNQNYGNDTLLIGVGVPNSKGNLQIQLYGTDGVDSSTGYPTYSSAIYYPLNDIPICFGTYDNNFYSYSLAFSSDIKDPADYYWANIQVSSSSSTTTTPIFATATATTSVTTPLVTSSGVLTLNGVSGVYLKYNSSDEAAIVLSSTYFKPFDTANNKLSLGTNSARWSNIYSVLGNYSGNITALGFVKSGSSDNYVLLGGGGHKLASDFMLKTDELSNNLTTITKSLSVTQAWMDTGITSTNLPANGTYIVQVQVSANDDIGHMWWCYNSGVMSWYKDATNDTETDEIILHRSGHAYGKTIYLRTIMQSSGVLKLQIGASSNIGNAYTYTFKFKRII